MINRRDFLSYICKAGAALPFLFFLEPLDEDDLEDIELNVLYPDAEEFKVEAGTFISSNENGFTLNWSNAPEPTELSYANDLNDFPKPEPDYVPWWERPMRPIELQKR